MQHLWTVMDQEPVAERPRRRAVPYLVAVVLVVLGVAARLMLDPWLGDRSVFVLFVPAVFVAAATGGIGPGVIAAVAGSIAGYGLLARNGFALGEVVETALFAGLAVLITFGGDRLRKARQLAEEMNRHVREREAHLQSILNTIPDAMIIIDDRGLVQSFSAAAEKLLGWKAEEVVGRNVDMLMPSPYAEAHDGYLERYAATGEQHIIGVGRAVAAKRKDGSVFPMALSVGEMTSAGHKFFTGFIRDLSERQEVESRVQQLQAELVHISRLSAMGEMAATLAHELNQPLSAISNYLKGGRRLLQAENPQSRAIEAMDKAADQALRAGQIIRRLREFVSRGEGEPKLESLPVLIDETTALALVGAKERGVEVTFDRNPGVDIVLADRIQIQQVLLNLIRNAIEAMEDSTRRRLLISVAASGDMARVTVADTGPGVSPEVADQLFQPFVTTKGQGMGIGLSISRTIIEAHGGRIWVEPNAEGGASFQFTLRRVRSEELV